MTKKLSCLYAIKPLSKNNNEVQFIHDISESYNDLLLNPFNPSNYRENLCLYTSLQL